MVDAIVSVVGGIISYFLGSFASGKLFDNPGLEEAFGAWKVLFAFIAAGSVFLAQSNKGLFVVFSGGVLGAIGLGLNYGSRNAIPPIASATDIAWFSFQLAQSCFVGIGVTLAAKLTKILAARRGNDHDQGQQPHEH